MSSTNEDKGHLAMVWIEDGAGAIVRGHADSLSQKGARLLLPEDPGLTPGRDVSLRLCLDRGAPILTASARVSSVQVEDGVVLCLVEWKAAAAGFKSLLASAA
jgi:hypothetical protein